MQPPIGDLIDRARDFLARDAPAVARAFLADWPDSRTRRTVPARPLAVARWLGVSAPGNSVAARALLEQLAEVADALDWRQTYAAKDVGATFMDNYGWTELVGPRGPAPSERLACGILILGPRTLYPPHRHEAYEVYVPLAGVAEWCQGARGWQSYAPGTAVAHASDVAHAMRTAEEPLVALYLWRSHNLAQSAQLEAR